MGEAMNSQPIRLFTKSAFKIAITCPTQLYYYRNNSKDGGYANQMAEDQFLQALAEGGFQVGELAKVYCSVDVGCDLKNLVGYDEPVRRTNDLLGRENVTIAEAGFRYENCFIRADIIRKKGSRIDLIEVKAKSWDPRTDHFVRTDKAGVNKVPGDIAEYVYDVAFQKYVLTRALREAGISCDVHAYLMMADKSKTAQVDGINQHFKLTKKNGLSVAEPVGNVAALKDSEHVLSEFDVDDVCEAIYAGNTGEQTALLGGMVFEEFIREKANWYCRNERHYTPLSVRCYKCPFYATEKTPGQKDGYDECWYYQTAHDEMPYTAYDAKPLLEELWGGGNTKVRSNLFAKHKYFLEQITSEDIGSPIGERAKPGLNHCQRKILQIAIATNRKEMIGSFPGAISEDGIYLDAAGLRAEMTGWKFPLHMIDFETTAVALPFSKGMRPYEQVAVQFSHHIIEKPGSIRHAGEFIDTEAGACPNFKFVRALKHELENDEGTVFRYAAHENTILNAIRVQLIDSNEPDKMELVAFIESIVHPRHGDRSFVAGARGMVDLCDIVKRYFYHPSMKGSNSIKVVLPAVLNASKYIQKKYSRPIYGDEIPSLHIGANKPVALVKMLDGKVLDPYKLLPDVSAYLPDGLLEDKSEAEDADPITINHGGAALTAYTMLQFADKGMSVALKEALLNYCELDTMAMVFIWEYFNSMCA